MYLACARRISVGEWTFRESYSHQDAAILNVTRACEQAIDLANYVIKKEKLGVPNSSAESFSLLARKNIISSVIAEIMMKMVGFRNIAMSIKY